MAFYKEKDGAVICTLPQDKEVHYFVPESHFDCNIDIVVGEFVNVIGIFNYSIFDTKTGKYDKIRTFKCPTSVLVQPYTMESIKGMKLTANSKKEDFRILKFKDGDKLIVSKQVPQMIENVEAFFKLFVIAGRVPNTIDYRDIWKYFPDSMELSGNKFDLNNQLFGILVSEMCRDESDLKVPFRNSKAKKNKKWNSYFPMSIKEVPKYTSPYVSITSENFDDSLVAATLLDDAKYSPLERVLTGKY